MYYKKIGIFIFACLLVLYGLPILAESLDSKIEVLNSEPRVVSVFVSDTSFEMVDDFPNGIILAPEYGEDKTIYFNGYVADNNIRLVAQ